MATLRRGKLIPPLILLLTLSTLGLSCDDDDTRSLMRIRIGEHFPSDGLTVTVRAQTIERSFSRVDFQRNEDGLLVTPTFLVPETGPIEITAALRALKGTAISSGAVSIEARSDFEWGVGIYRTSSDISNTCYSCFGVESFSILESAQQEPGEKLWIAWGGTPRGSDFMS